MHKPSSISGAPTIRKLASVVKPPARTRSKAKERPFKAFELIIGYAPSELRDEETCIPRYKQERLLRLILKIVVTTTRKDDPRNDRTVL